MTMLPRWLNRSTIQYTHKGTLPDTYAGEYLIHVLDTVKRVSSDSLDPIFVSLAGQPERGEPMVS
jgi:hypothetical protein